LIHNETKKALTLLPKFALYQSNPLFIIM